MTEKLKALLHEQAILPEFDPPDVAQLVEVGTRRRRRRLTAVTGGVAAAAVVGALALAGANGDQTRSDDAPTAPPPGRTITWATGSTLHTQEGVYDLGHPIAAYVRTSVGYVFTDGLGGLLRGRR